MREIKFRGKNTVVTKKWLYGSYFVGLNDLHYIRHIIVHNNSSTAVIEIVNPKTVGQWTGLQDINKVDVYESDKVRVFGGDCYNGIWERNFETTVVFIGGEFCCVCDKGIHYSFSTVEFVEVIGSIHDKQPEPNA